MAVPNSMADLATLAGSNSPAGSEAIGNSLDNYLRAHAAIIRSTNALASATIPAASTTDVGLADAESVQVTGAATITSLGAGFVGCKRELRFTGVCTLTHSTNLVLPAATNITAAAGDVISFRCFGSGQWVCTGRARPAISSADVVAGLGYTPVNKAGDTMSGALGIQRNTGPMLSLQTVSGGNLLEIGNSLVAPNDGIGWIYNRANQPLVFGTNNIERFRISAAGGQKNMTVTGGLFSSGADSTLFFQNRSGAEEWAWYCVSNVTRLYNGVADVATWDSSGNTSLAGYVWPSVNAAGSKKLSKISIGTSAPGVLADGELYMRY